MRLIGVGSCAETRPDDPELGAARLAFRRASVGTFIVPLERRAFGQIAGGELFEDALWPSER
jgi:hypothetical protein